MTAVIDTNDKEVLSICPDTGLPTYTRPEWTDVAFDANSLFSLAIIGENILHIKSDGYSTHAAAVASTRFAEKIIEGYFGAQKNIFYLVDFKGVTGISKNARAYFINSLIKSKRLKALIMCSPSPLMVLAVNLRKKFSNKKFNIVVEKNHSAAVKRAVDIANQRADIAVCTKNPFAPPLSDPEPIPLSRSKSHSRWWRHPTLPTPAKRKKRPEFVTRVTREEWHLELNGYSVKYELINGNIIHKISNGCLDVDHVIPVYEMQEQILKSCGLEDHPYYIINDAKTLEEPSLKTRKAYSHALSLWFKKYPGVRQTIIYGASRLQQAGLSISMYFKPFSIVFASTFDDALAIVQEDQENKPLDRSIFFHKMASHRDTVKHYASELNFYLGNIDWEVEGINQIEKKKGDDHPFKAVYDAIELIKSDIDELFQDREMAQVALKESDEMSRALLNATHDLALLTHSDGTIISVNQPFATFLGEAPGHLKGKKLPDFFPHYAVKQGWHHFTKVVITGEPVSFETRSKGRDFQNTLYPVFNRNKKVDRLALYSRDITRLKEAEAQIHGLTQQLIKAQENERKRISRDLHDNVAQDLASLIIQSDSLFDGFPDAPGEVKKRCGAFSRVLKMSIASIRDLVYDLSPPGLEQVGFAKLIGHHCLDFSDKNGTEIDLYTAGLEGMNLETDTKLNLFRVLQEALNNVYKHAKATRITVRLLTSHPHLIMRIEDNGCGFDPKVRMLTALQEKRMGLKSMEERVNLLGGELDIRSRKGSGTRVVVKYPYTRDSSDNSKWA